MLDEFGRGSIVGCNMQSWPTRREWTEKLANEPNAPR